jgi:2-deoxy-D-gluconate 3-dehydrogenase
MELARRVAIVTGASKGLGAAITEAYANEGVNVVAVARGGGAHIELAKKFPGVVVPVGFDMANFDECDGLVEFALSTFGRLDIVVNNAGIAPAGAFIDMPSSTWSEVIAVNLLGPAALARAAGPTLVGQQRGKVINVASTSGLRGKPSLAAYSSSKGALLRFTEALSGEWAPFNVQVNAIAPGAFATDAQRAVLESPEILIRRLRKIPAGRMGAIEEIGALACYLASPLSDFVTGATYVIDGGESSKL